MDFKVHHIRVAPLESRVSKALKTFTASKLTQFSSKYLVYPDSDMSVSQSKLTKNSSLAWPPALKHTTFSGYQMDQMQGTELFKSVTQDPEPPKKPDDESILVTGFGMRNASSLARILARTKQKQFVSKYAQMFDLDDQAEEEYDIYDKIAPSITSSTSKSLLSSEKSTTESMSQTESVERGKKASLEYLLGLERQEEEEKEEAEEIIPPEVKESDEFIFATSKSTREAQKYLRSHRIFEFFQFLIAHMLASKTDNPIEFILDLLNQCLLYRSGLGTAPVLYGKNHIAELFRLMDRLDTGFVEIEQYHTAMKTLGICSYNDNPKTVQGNLVAKEDFIEEMYDAEIDIFNDLIKRHRKLNQTPSQDYLVVDRSGSTNLSQGSAHLIPDSFYKKPQFKDIVVIKKEARYS